MVSNCTWARAARLLAAAPAAREEYAVDLADEAARQREALAQPGEPVVEGGDVVRDLDNVVERHPGCLVEIEEQEVREG